MNDITIPPGHYIINYDLTTGIIIINQTHLGQDVHHYIHNYGGK